MKVSHEDRMKMLQELSESLASGDSMEDDEFTSDEYAEANNVTPKRAQVELRDGHRSGAVERRWVVVDGLRRYAYRITDENL